MRRGAALLLLLAFSVAAVVAAEVKVPSPVLPPYFNLLASHLEDQGNVTLPESRPAQP
jgi:hypothetical protein